jgi:ADP-heptose:LPS heptosyltransferase
VLRLNPRLGNILFLTPMLRSLAAGLPAAAIDVVIQSAAQKTLLENLPGIRRVWIQPTKSVFGILNLLRHLRAQRYDLAIDPIGNSINNRLVLALCGARQRAGFAVANQWLALTHAGAAPASRHQAIQAVELLRSAIAKPRFAYLDTLAIAPGAAAQATAEHRWRRLFPERLPDGPVVGFFAQATGKKQFTPSWWHHWRATMGACAPAAVLVQICPPDVGPLNASLAHVSIAPLDELAAFLARLDIFVAADSGPMHLAAAAGVPVVGLFRATSPAAYAPLGPHCVSLTGDELTGEAVAVKIAYVLAKADKRPR